MLPDTRTTATDDLPAALVTRAVALAVATDVPTLRTLVDSVRPLDLITATRPHLASQPGHNGPYVTHPRLVLVDCCPHPGPDSRGYCSCLVPWTEVLNGAVYDSSDPLPYLAVLAGTADQHCLRTALVDLAAALPDRGQRLIARLCDLLRANPWQGVHDVDPVQVLADCCPHPGRACGGYCSACHADLATIAIREVARA